MERVLVCVLSQTRSHDVAWPSFKRHVLDELDADLALAITFDETYDYVNPYWQHAKYRWTAAEPDDVGKAFDLAQAALCEREKVEPSEWRTLLRIKGTWQGGIRSDDPQPSRAAQASLFCRWLLSQGLTEEGLVGVYDRFVITRSDFVWLCPHPPMSILERETLWIPDGEHWGGICDRHLIVAREDVIAALSLLDDVLLHPHELYEEMKHIPQLNMETLLDHHLARRNLKPRVKFFPYVMYTARSLRDAPSVWTRGFYEPSLGHVVKYPEELRRARGYATLIKTREDWEKGDWREFDPNRAAARYRRSRADRTWSLGRRVVHGLRRPGRIARFRRYRQQRRSQAGG